MPTLEHTQRVNVTQTGRTASTGSASSVRRNVEAQRKAAMARKKKNRRIILISTIAAAVLLLIVIIILGSMFLFPPMEDNGLILNNVFVAGVNLGGMTKEQAITALHSATDNTYTVLDMSVQVLDTTKVLSPQDTGAKLDVEAAVEAAYNYGRTGSRSQQQKAQNQANSSGYTVSILPYLSLDTDYIQTVVDEFGASYSTLLTDTTYEIVGSEKPSMNQTEYDTTYAYQTLVIHMGTAQYDMSTDNLYQQILDAYNINIFQVSGQCSMTAPETLDWEAIYQSFLSEGYCVEPINAYYDQETGTVVPEVYGYGFLWEDLNTAVNAATYGANIEIPMTFLQPSITAEFYDEIYRDTLGTITSTLDGSSAWNSNIATAAATINGTILLSGQEFSFNDALGALTAGKGYSSVEIFVGKSSQEVVGGGVCQLATALYNSVLQADLEIVEHHTHSYAPTFGTLGFDAEVFRGSMDFRFKNNTDYPIQILAEVNNGALTVTLIGTDSKDYSVRYSFKTTKTVSASTVYNTMLEDNPSGYREGDVLSEGITGYTISVYKYIYDKTTNRLLSEELLSTVVYAKRDRVVVKIAVTEDPGNSGDDPSTEDPGNGGSTDTGDGSGSADQEDPGDSGSTGQDPSDDSQNPSEGTP